jgi:uncharacterized coiled-coil protein SlyX
VQSETLYSPFTPLHQFSAEKLTKFEKRNEIIDLTKVMGETRQQYVDLEKKINMQTKEITDLNKALQVSESKSSNATAQIERMIHEHSEFKKNAKVYEKTLMSQNEKLESEISGYKEASQQAIQDLDIQKKLTDT